MKEELLEKILHKLAESIPYSGDYHHEDYLELDRLIEETFS
jgi:hypothetical protein